MHSRRHAEKKAAEAAAELTKLTKSNADKASHKIGSEKTWERRTIDVQLELARHHMDDHMDDRPVLSSGDWTDMTCRVRSDARKYL